MERVQENSGINYVSVFKRSGYELGELIRATEECKPGKAMLVTDKALVAFGRHALDSGLLKGAEPRKSMFIGIINFNGGTNANLIKFAIAATSDSLRVRYGEDDNVLNNMVFSLYKKEISGNVSVLEWQAVRGGFGWYDVNYCASFSNERVVLVDQVDLGMELECRNMIVSLRALDPLCGRPDESASLDKAQEAFFQLLLKSNDYLNLGLNEYTNSMTRW